MSENPYRDVAAELAGSAFPSIEYRRETESTNADALSLLGDHRYDGHTIVAEYQRRGIGRKGRVWEARPNTALLFTTILPRTIDSQNLWLVPFWVALAVREGLLDCGLATTLVWPNDVLLGGRKVAGILCQSQVTKSAARVACGVGINVRRPPAREPAESSYSRNEPAWAFCDDVARVERPRLLAAILRACESTLATLDEPTQIVRAWEAAADLPKRYRIARDNAALPFEAMALALQSGGALHVACDDGTRETVELADARILRQ